MLLDFSKEKFDVVIQAGQSNSQGCGLGPAEEPFTPSGDIWYLNNNFTISMAQEDVVGNEIVTNFSLSFATEYVKKGRLCDGRKLLIVRAGIGGTGFADKRWGMEDDLFLTMMEMIKTALALNPENRLVAFLWHQGETDAGFGSTYETHYDNLKKLIDAVRGTFGRGGLPFIAADFVNHWKSANIEICEPIIQAIKDICADVGNASFIGTDELQSNDQRVGNCDTIHFCREAQNLLGKKYYAAFESLALG